jgi:chemotaxis protein methyltransferase CheR
MRKTGPPVPGPEPATGQNAAGRREPAPRRNPAPGRASAKAPPAGGYPSVIEDPGELPPRVFDKVRKLLYEQAGIDLRPGKEALVSSRLSRGMREKGCPSFEAYVDRAAADATGEGLLDLIDALTTNFTSFLREPAHFEFMRRKILPALAARPRLEIWCAAAATGEEPYSIAFTVLDVLGAGAAPRCRILSTDISTRALDKARRAVYPADRFSGVPGEWLPRYLLKGEKDSAGLYKVRPEVARMVQFERLNLIEPARSSASFPLIWCRNVMIYFDQPTQERVVQRLERSLEPGGYLFVGHSESLSAVRHSLEFIQPAIYRRPG